MSFQPTQQQIRSLVLAALSIRSTINENQAYSKKNSVAQIRFVCVAEHTALMIHNQTNSNSAAQASIEERFKTVVMVPCPNIARFRKTLIMFRTIQHTVAT